MNKSRKIMVAALAAALIFSSGGCGKKESASDGSLTKAVDQASEVAKDVAKKGEEAATAAVKATEEAVEKAKEGAEKAVDKAKEATSKETAKDDKAKK